MTQCTKTHSLAPTAARISRRESGQALVELALAIPALLLLALGVIEIGRYAYISILIGNAARAGAAYGSQSSPASADTAGIAAAAKLDFAGGSTSASKNNGLGGNTLTVSSTISCSCDSAGTFTPAPSAGYCNGPPVGTNNNAGKCAAGAHWVVISVVTASGTFNSLFNYPGIPSSVTVSRTASIRVAQN